MTSAPATFASKSTHAAAHPYGAVSLIFAGSNTGFYLFSVTGDQFSLSRVDRVSWTAAPIIDWTHSAAIRTGTRANRLKVVRSGSVISLYVNGAEVGSASDGVYRGTWVGMEADSINANFEGRFDNFAVYTDACVHVVSVRAEAGAASFESQALERRLR